MQTPDVTSGRQFCPSRTTEQFLLSNFIIELSHRWQNLGILLDVTQFNLSYFSTRTSSLFFILMAIGFDGSSSSGPYSASVLRTSPQNGDRFLV